MTSIAQFCYELKTILKKLSLKKKKIKPGRHGSAPTSLALVRQMQGNAYKFDVNLVSIVSEFLQSEILSLKKREKEKHYIHIYEIYV